MGLDSTKIVCTLLPENISFIPQNSNFVLVFLLDFKSLVSSTGWMAAPKAKTVIKELLVYIHTFNSVVSFVTFPLNPYILLFKAQSMNVVMY